MFVGVGVCTRGWRRGRRGGRLDGDALCVDEGHLLLFSVGESCE